MRSEFNPVDYLQPSNVVKLNNDFREATPFDELTELKEFLRH